MMSKTQIAILGVSTTTVLIQHGCGSDDDDDYGDACMNLPKDADGDVVGAVVLNWRILNNQDVADSLGVGQCLECVQNNLSKTNDLGAVVEAFVDDCQSPPINAAKVPTVAGRSSEGAFEGATFRAPQLTKQLAPPGPCNDFPNDNPENWQEYCGLAGDNKGANADECCTTVINLINWVFPRNEDVYDSRPSWNKLAGLGATTAQTDEADPSDVMVGCGVGSGTCTYDDAKNAFETAGSDSWPATAPGDFTPP